MFLYIIPLTKKEQKVSSPTLITKDYASLLSSLAYNQENLVLQFVWQFHLTQLQ